MLSEIGKVRVTLAPRGDASGRFTWRRPKVTGWDLVDSVEDLGGLAPDAFAALETMRARATVIDTAGPAKGSAAVERFAEQFNVDVASLTVEHRAAAAAALGDDLFGFLQATWVNDMADRIDHAWRQLFRIDLDEWRRRTPQPTADPDPAGALWQAIDTFLPAVARLSALDPVTTEVVRLKGARAHDCRLCRSLRNVGALDAGADEETFDAIDRFEDSDLDQTLKVALRMVDAIIWEPRAWPSRLAETVRETFEPEEAVEIVLDVVRNGANKIAVALEADQPNVIEGVEFFAMDENGALTYGLDHH